ncbi:hypothetical protein HUJ04_011132 [Dendroctonus ponderosae]|nr:hypothetical protein HUJ04_011132 [Dendroctonus ponderosae]
MVRELRESITALRNDMQSLKMRENGRKANMTDNKRPSMKIDARTTKVAPTDSKKTTLPEKSNKRKFEDDSAEVPVPKKAGLETVIESETDMEVENPNKPSNYADAARKIPPVNVKGHEKWTQMVAHLENEGINLEKSAMTKEGYRILQEEFGHLLEYPSSTFYACDAQQNCISDFMRIHQATASWVIKKVSTTIADLRPRYVKMPSNDNMYRTQNSLFQIARFPRDIGLQ